MPMNDAAITKYLIDTFAGARGPANAVALQQPHDPPGLFLPPL
jgi:hypothetical protein